MPRAAIGAALALFTACSGDGGYRSPTAPPQVPPPLPVASGWVDYIGEATTSQGQVYSRDWNVKISGETIFLRLDWGERVEAFEGRIQKGALSAVAYPPYLDECCDVVELRLSGAFSEDLASFEAAMTAIVGDPETERWETAWRARRR
jgi:hypothetical protein